MQRGEIWVATWPNDPTKKPRPVLVVTNNLRNHLAHIADVVVVKITSYQRRDGTPKPVNQAEDVIVTLKKQSIIRCGSLYTVEKSWLVKKITNLDELTMANINKKLALVLGIMLHSTTV